MRQILLFAILLLVIACSSSDNNEANEIVGVENEENIDNDDNDLTGGDTEIPNNINSYMLYYMQYPRQTNPGDLTKLVSIKRNNENSITRRTGGVYDANLDPAVGFQYRFSVRIYDEVIYKENMVIIEKKSDDPTLVIPIFKRTLILDQNQRIVQKIIETTEPNKIDTLDLDYNASGKLSTMISRDNTNPKEIFFYLNSKDNLDSIVTNEYNEELVLTKKIIEKFMDYDNSENPTKDLFIFEELFPRSLSANNYSFYFLDEHTITPNSAQRFSTYREWNLKYKNDGSVIFNEL